MARVLDADAFAEWFDAFLPGLSADDRILAKATVTDESDGYLAHLNGLNLTRAGQIIRIRKALVAGGATGAGRIRGSPSASWTRRWSRCSRQA